MHVLAPEFEGRLAVARIPDDFLPSVARRVQSGLLVPGVRTRAQYEVTRLTRDALAFRASDLWTAISIGLNEVELDHEGSSTIRYRVRFRRWTLYAVALSAVIGVLLALGWAFDISGIAGEGPVHASLFWASVGFWGFAWPWILTALHKKPAARCLERILREELEKASAR